MLRDPAKDALGQPSSCASEAGITVAQETRGERLTRCPDDDRGGAAEAGHEGSMTTINRILYATDLSSTSEPAWDEARRLGRVFNAEILVLHVVAPPLVFPVEGYFPPDLYAEVLRNARRDAEKGFDRLLGSVAGSGLSSRNAEEILALSAMVPPPVLPGASRLVLPSQP
jgi:Universal stress protein family